MKNIIFVYTCKTSSNTFGGVKTVLDSYAQHKKEFESMGYNLNFFNYKPELVGRFGKLGHIIYGLQQYIALRRYLKGSVFYAVHIHTSRDYLFLKDIFLARMIKRCFNRPVLLTIHVGTFETVFCKTHWIQKKLIKLHNQYVDKTLFLSKSIQNEFIHVGFKNNKTNVLYNFHNLTPSNNSLLKDSKTDVLRLLFVGAIHREKGILDLLNGLKLLNNIPYHLDICGLIKDVGVKNEYERLTQELSDRVTVHGLVTGETKTNLYDQADILVLPSYHEGFPMVILEALRTSCAIISTRVGATPEILTEDNVYWVDIKSPQHIADAVSYLYSNPEALDVMKRNNYILADRYSLNNHIVRLCQLYSTVES